MDVEMPCNSTVWGAIHNHAYSSFPFDSGNRGIFNLWSPPIFLLELTFTFVLLYSDMIFAAIDKVLMTTGPWIVYITYDRVLTLWNKVLRNQNIVWFLTLRLIFMPNLLKIGLKLIDLFKKYKMNKWCVFLSLSICLTIWGKWMVHGFFLAISKVSQYYRCDIVWHYKPTG